MARPKKDGKYINIFMNAELLKRLEEYCKIVGQTKTIAIERAVEQMLVSNEIKKEEK